MVKAKKRAWEKKQAENLTDRYVKKAILNTVSSREMGLKTADIPQEFIEMKRQQLKFYRALRQCKREVKKGGLNGSISRVSDLSQKAEREK